jgi:hypothetical protein
MPIAGPGCRNASARVRRLAASRIASAACSTKAGLTLSVVRVTSAFRGRRTVVEPHRTARTKLGRRTFLVLDLVNQGSCVPKGAHATARIPHPYWMRGGRVAV